MIVLVKEYDLSEVTVEAGSVHQQLCWRLIFVILYILMRFNIVCGTVLSVILMVCVTLCYGVSLLLSGTWKTVWPDMKIGVTFITFTVILCPVLHSLTESISTDTIYAMTFFLLVASWACHTYTTDLNQKSVDLNAFSVNAGLMASLCLASRLSSLWYTFIMVTSAVVIFGLQPRFTRQIKILCYPYLHCCITLILTTVCLLSLYLWASILMTCLFLIFTFSINILCPLIFLKMQTWKNNIHGPWDEAVPD